MIETELLHTALLLLPVGMLAGLIDAMAGGGGLLSIPALLWAGLSPIQTLATNKAQAVFGSGMATLQFIRRGHLEVRGIALAVACTFAGSAAGALLVQQIDSAFLERLIPVLLIAFALYFWLSPRVSDLDSHQRIGSAAFAVCIGLGIGFYDGFFGPGTGTFFAMSYVALLGYNLRRATAHTKALNFTSNLAALLFFLAGGHILWPIAVSMAIGQLAGAWIGAHMVMRHGAALVRPVLVISSMLISGKLLWEQFG
ncbi:TSUP family transporter [Thiorhodococcus mannitoliphagus]|uniref:Probable membrane transporter protein n=1 Tax=Thiorhodococcus mannitoliphagus TaxID=329406 RepID=A0A6P1DT07_9GAMM|nr:TSUP family transporter [Thiorhodococcus mannitoliphagus]NEX20071.1 TSUP family transporter [Thiorhodococcus mannitoliphagus]